MATAEVWTGFCEGAYRERSPVIDAATCINLYPNSLSTPANAKQCVLYGTPGLRAYGTAGTGPGRGLFSQNGRTFTVSGNHLYELFPMLGTVSASLGTLANDNLPVSFATNGQAGDQLAICSAGGLYLYRLSSGVFSGPIALPFASPAVVDFCDGYFLVLQAGTPTIWFSALEDGSQWDALDFFTRSDTADAFVAMVVVSSRIFAFGSQTAEIFYNSGDADTPFVPYPGSLVDAGTISAHTICRDGAVVGFLAQTVNRTRQIMAWTFGSLPTAISTPAVDFALSQMASLEDAEAFTIGQDGHPCLGWTCPSAGAQGETWLYDQREQQWHQRAGFNSSTGDFTRWPVRGLAAVGAQVLAGDYLTGAIYQVDPTTYTAASGTIKRVRRAPYLGREAQWVFLQQIELLGQMGVGLVTGQGSAPVVLCRISKDGGQSWGPAMTASLGALGATETRAIWRPRVRVRLDRLVVEVSQTDPVPVAWGPGLSLRWEQGTGQL